jgi:hypothetical protein
VSKHPPGVCRSWCTGKGKQVSKDKEKGTGKKGKSEDSSNERNHSSHWSSPSISSVIAVTTVNRLLICFKNF